MSLAFWWGLHSLMTTGVNLEGITLMTRRQNIILECGCSEKPSKMEPPPDMAASASTSRWPVSQKSKMPWPLKTEKNEKKPEPHTLLVRIPNGIFFRKLNLYIWYSPVTYSKRTTRMNACAHKNLVLEHLCIIIHDFPKLGNVQKLMKEIKHGMDSCTMEWCVVWEGINLVLLNLKSTVPFHTSAENTAACPESVLCTCRRGKLSVFLGLGAWCLGLGRTRCEGDLEMMGML
jgi:hypothetical protein